MEIQNTLKPQGYIILTDQNPNDFIKIDDEEDDEIIYNEALLRGYYELQKQYSNNLINGLDKKDSDVTFVQPESKLSVK